MKKSFVFKSMAVLSLLFVFAACSKYEEGSKFTILTKKMRMVNKWTLVNYTINDSAQSLSGVTATMDLQKDGTAIVAYTSGGFTFSDTGKWDFSSDKADLILTDSNGSAETYEIVQLKNKDLKLRQVTNNNTHVWTYEGE